MSLIYISPSSVNLKRETNITLCRQVRRLPAHHHPPQVGVGAGPLTEYFDRLVISEAEHSLILSEVLEDCPPVTDHSCKVENNLKQTPKQSLSSFNTNLNDIFKEKTLTKSYQNV